MVQAMILLRSIRLHTQLTSLTAVYLPVYDQVPLLWLPLGFLRRDSLQSIGCWDTRAAAFAPNSFKLSRFLQEIWCILTYMALGCTVDENGSFFKAAELPELERLPKMSCRRTLDVRNFNGHFRRCLRAAPGCRYPHYPLQSCESLQDCRHFIEHGWATYCVRKA
jgi:hypothetical protein